MGERAGPPRRAVETTGEGFSGPVEPEARVVELRVAIATEVRRRREAAGMSQAGLAERLGVRQPRIPPIESAAGASLDAMLRAYFAVGGTLDDLPAVVAAAASHVERQTGGRR